MVKQFQAKQFVSVKFFCWAIFLLFLLMVVLVRSRLLNLPLERDEGEYAYFGQLLLHGIPPYQLAYNMKLPGTYAAYALCMAIFGQSIQGVHLGLLIVNLASIILLFFITKRLFGYLAGIFSAISYAALSINQSVLGLQGHAEHFVVLMALCGSLLLLKAAETEKNKFVFLSGLFFGLAFLMKQSGIFFVPFGLFYLCWAYFKKHPAQKSAWVFKLITYTLGAILPFAVTCTVFLFTGVFDKFWFWVFQYAFKYQSAVPLGEAWNTLKYYLAYVTHPFRPVWYIAFLGLGCVFIDAKAKKQVIFVSVLLITSFLSLCPGFVFREHYFLAALPVISILAGCCIDSAHRFIRDRKQLSFWSFVPMVIFVIILLYPFYRQKHYLFESTPVQVSRLTYGANPFIESIGIANYLKAHSSPNEAIAVLGSEPQIYFYSQRRSATGYIYAYPLMEKQPFALRMQQEMIHEIEAAKPRYLVFVHVYMSWLFQPESEKMIFEWAKGYIPAHYKIAGVIDIVSKDRTDYYWDAQAQNVQPLSPYNILVFKRQD